MLREIQVKTRPVEVDESILRRHTFNQKAEDLALLGEIPARIQWNDDFVNEGWIDDFEIALPPEAWEAYGTTPGRFTCTPALTDAIGKVKAALKIERNQYVKEALSKKIDVTAIFDGNLLTPPYKRLVKKLIENVPIHERLYENQLHPNAAKLREKVEKEGTPEDIKLMNRNSEATCSFFGSEDFLGENFYKCAVASTYPLRENFSGMWPKGMSLELLAEMTTFAKEDNPFLSPVTSVYWNNEGVLAWRALIDDPVLGKDVELAATIWEEAALIGREENEKAGEEVIDKGLITQLDSLAKAYRSRDSYPYKQSYIDRMDAGGPVTLTVGPFEEYDDEGRTYKVNADGTVSMELIKYHKKAAFQMFLGLKNTELTERLERMSSNAVMLDAELAKLVTRKKGAGIYEGRDPSTIKTPKTSFIQIIAAAGDGRGAKPIAIAHALPNMYYKEIGSWTESFSVANREKSRKILTKIGEQILPQDQQGLVNEDSFINTVHWHEIGHTIGPARDGERTFTENGVTKTVNPKTALGQVLSAIEETKADAHMIWASGLINGQGSDVFLEDLATTSASIVRSLRFGLKDSHGEANAIRAGYYVAHGVMTIDANGKLSVDKDRIYSVNENLLAELVYIEATGNLKAAKALLKEYLQPGLTAIAPLIAKINTAGVPVDIDIEYKVENL
ncbi:hypothetical protein KKA47_03010 [bacterium]|nr:hypothetical protein [bacterium]